MSSKKIYFENLDGLRFVCFLSVFFYHSFYTSYSAISSNPVYQFVKSDVFGNGNLGVNFFFVLSGFLITYLLVEENRRTNGIHIGYFWLRRALRIWPLFYFCVFFGFWVFPFLKSFFGEVPEETASISYYFLFINNFDIINNGLPDASILGVLWSVAIEEQFYLFWPIILFLVPIEKYWIPFCSIILVSIIFRFWFQSELVFEFHTLSCIGDMAVGGMGAWLVQTRNLDLKFMSLSRWKISVIYVLIIGVFFFKDELALASEWIVPFERFYISLIFLVVILEQSYSKNSLFKMKNFKLVTKLGQVTYGLYCLHFIAILVSTTLTKTLGWNSTIWQVLFLETFLSLTLSILIAQLSFNYLEKPFLKLKERFVKL